MQLTLVGLGRTPRDVRRVHLERGLESLWGGERHRDGLRVRVPDVESGEGVVEEEHLVVVVHVGVRVQLLAHHLLPVRPVEQPIVKHLR